MKAIRFSAMLLALVGGGNKQNQKLTNWILKWKSGYFGNITCRKHWMTNSQTWNDPKNNKTKKIYPKSQLQPVCSWLGRSCPRLILCVHVQIFCNKHSQYFVEVRNSFKVKRRAIISHFMPLFREGISDQMEDGDIAPFKRDVIVLDPSWEKVSL